MSSDVGRLIFGQPALAGVEMGVEDELAGGGKPFLAQVTLELARPELADMLGHVGQGGEGLVALAAQEGLVAVVCVHVTHQAAQLGEGCSAALTTVPPLPSVRQAVALQVMPLHELFATLPT